MTIFFGLLFILFSLLGFLRSRRFLAPTFIAPVSWGAILLIYGILDHGMPSLSINVLLVILLWVLSLLVGMYLFSEVGSREIVKKEFNPFIKDIYYYIALFGSIPGFYVAYMQATTMGMGNIFLNLRFAGAGLSESEYNYGIWRYAFTFAYVSFLIELYCNDNKKRIKILFILNLIQAIITMSKSGLFILFLSIFAILILQKRITKTTIIVSLSSLMFLMSLTQLLRSGEEKDNVVSDMLYSYTLGGVPALDKVVIAETSSKNWGQFSMKFFKTFVRAFVGKKNEKEDLDLKNDITDEGYVYLPLPTNVFTVIGPFWWDFGYWGIIIFGFIIGGLSGYYYRLMRAGVVWAAIPYCFLFSVLILQFFGEFIFSNLSFLLQLILLSMIAFKFKYILVYRRSFKID